MKITITFILLSLYSSVSYAEVLYCLMSSDVLIDPDNNEPDVYNYTSGDANQPDSWFEFNLTENTTSIFWTNDDETKERVVEKITKINDQLYYGTITENDDIGYTTYVFKNNLTDGFLAEEDYFGKFKCFEKTQQEIEQLYKISFKPYKLLDNNK